jgi:hypothetical protein
MIPFIVKGTVRVTPYMDDYPFAVEDIRIVMAVDADEARAKYQDYWDQKTEEYSIYYHADGEVMETIL